nr:hypothetical protein [Brevundimonas diminuta]
MSEAEVEARSRSRFKWPLSRTRLIELTVVVFGVVIALGMESVAEEIRLQGDARELESAFQSEVFYAVVYSWERQAAEPCLSQRLASLAQRVAAAGEGPWTAEPDFRRVAGGLEFATPQTYRSPSRQWMTTTFDRALSTEAFKRIPRDRAAEYAGIFGLMAERRDANSAEFLSAAALAPLAYDGVEMNAEIKADMLQQIALVDRHRALALVSSDLIIEAALALPGNGVRSAIRENRNLFTEMGQRAREGHGACVDLGATERLMARL